MRLFFLLILILSGLTTNAQTFSNHVKYKATSVNLNFRSDPNIHSQIYQVIPKGTYVKLLDNCDCEWLPISYNGRIGYISSKYLKKEINQKYNARSNSSYKYYKNSKGEKVQSPTYYRSRPVNATALCKDGTYSFSRSRRGTCSGHGGVARWL